MNAYTAAWTLAIGSIVVSLFVSPEAGLFLAIAAIAVAIIAAIDASPDRRDARHRNHARRK